MVWKFKIFFSAIYISIEVFELLCLVASMITYGLFRHMHLLQNVNLFQMKHVDVSLHLHKLLCVVKRERASSIQHTRHGCTTNFAMEGFLDFFDALSFCQTSAFTSIFRLQGLTASRI